ncbi:glycosyltransferase family 2 protein [Paucibacter sp. B51]|uniref:glycosyltransferase family 2 protein n=1 Tax=Paucibacter sp. B51 TaxID=2993315 RepID=UPI0022EBEC78|nr:glycosyltransferase [Paucibacter sp. B51]
MTSPQIALIIPTRNRPTLMARALDSVAGQGLAPQKVIVDDDGDWQDGRTADVVAAAIDTGLRARYVRNGGARGAAAARNFSARSTKSLMVAFLDVDSARS